MAIRDRSIPSRKQSTMAAYSSLHIKKFREKVKLMNDQAGKQLTMTAKDARDLHNEMFGLIDLVAELQSKTQYQDEANLASQGLPSKFDGGTF